VVLGASNASWQMQFAPRVFTLAKARGLAYSCNTAVQD
jgi:hypothetical protein